MSSEGGEDGVVGLERKHALKLERLAALEDARLRQSAARRQVVAAESSPLESTQAFLQSFAAARASADQALTALLNSKEKDGDHEPVKRELERVSVDLSSLEARISKASYFLPSFESRSCQDAVAELRRKVQSVSAELAPKKKFSFRKSAKAGGGAVAGGGDGGRVGEVGGEVRSCGGEVGVVVGREVRDGVGEVGGEFGGEERKPINNVDSTPGIRDAIGASLTRDLCGGEFVLSGLRDCHVLLRGQIAALYIHGLQGCHIYTGPISGSTHIEDVKNCTLMLASHQIRIHHATSTDFYLRVRSRPIVEYTSGVRFAPYVPPYSGAQEDLAASNLAHETGLWKSVDDFRWLRVTPSPNWSVIPEDQRITPTLDRTETGIEKA